MPTAEAIILRGSLHPAALCIEARTLSFYCHAALLLSDNTVVESKALQNRVLHHAYTPSPIYGWERRFPLASLGPDACAIIGQRALRMVGEFYDWDAFRGHISGHHADDPRRVICFELVGRATDGYIRWRKPPEALTARDMVRTLRSVL